MDTAQPAPCPAVGCGWRTALCIAPLAGRVPHPPAFTVNYSRKPFLEGLLPPPSAGNRHWHCTPNLTPRKKDLPALVAERLVSRLVSSLAAWRNSWLVDWLIAGWMAG